MAALGYINHGMVSLQRRRNARTEEGAAIRTLDKETPQYSVPNAGVKTCKLLSFPTEISYP